MSELDQLVKILKAIASQQKANALAISQLTTNIENITAQMEEDRQQQRVYAYSDRLEKDKLRAMFSEMIGVMAVYLAEDDDGDEEDSEDEDSGFSFDLGLDESGDSGGEAEGDAPLDLGLEQDFNFGSDKG